MEEYKKLLEKMLHMGENGDTQALIDMFALIRNIEMEKSVTVLSKKPGIIDEVVPDPEYFTFAHDWNKRLRAAVNQNIKESNDIEKCFSLYWNTHLFDAKYNFDSFMLYIEKDRQIEQQFWLPRRKKLLHVAQILQDMEDNKLDELFLSFPPRTGKTTLMVFFLLWVILRDSERSNLYCSYTDSVVSVFYNGVLEILQDPFTYKWKDVFPAAEIASTNAKDLLLNIDRRKRYASFTGRSLYGTLNGACDCNGYQIADDLISGIEEAMSKDRLDSVWLKVDNNYLPRGKEGAKKLWIGTRWAQRDCQARRMELLENDERFANVRWKAINVPALDENDESNFEYDFNVGFSSDYYKQRRASFERNNDMASWFAQYQGVPIDRAGALFEPEDLRYYNGVLPDDEPDRVFMAVDPAWGGGDFVAAPVCVQYGNDIYVADVVYDNGDKKVTQPKIAAMVEKYGVQAVTVEATRATASYTEGIDSFLCAKGIRINLQSSTKNWTMTGKEQRIFDKAPDIRERMIFIESGKRSAEYEQFMNNVFAFKVGAKNKNDDAPDSLAQAIHMCYFSNPVAVLVKRPF